MLCGHSQELVMGDSEGEPTNTHVHKDLCRESEDCSSASVYQCDNLSHFTYHSGKEQIDHKSLSGQTVKCRMLNTYISQIREVRQAYVMGI